MIVLGLDPGLAFLGWAVLEVAGGGRALLDCGTVKTQPALTDDARLGQLLGEVATGLATFPPVAVGVERHVWQGPERSANNEAFRISRVSGALEGLVRGAVPSATVIPVTRGEALRALSATTEQAADSMVRRLLKFPTRTTQHARDAAMVAWAASQRLGRAGR